MRLATDNLFPLFAEPAEDEELTPAEARDVLLIVGEAAEQLRRCTNSVLGLRRRLDAIAGAIVAFMGSNRRRSGFGRTVRGRRRAVR